MKKLKAGSSAKGIMAGAIGEAAGAAVSEREYERLRAAQEGASAKEDVLKKLNEKSLKELKGSAVSENEMKKFKNSIPKKAKGGMSKKQLDIAEAVAENSLLPGGTLIQLRQAAKAVKKSKGGFIIGKGADYIKDLL
jgi:hypothetical protein